MKPIPLRSRQSGLTLIEFMVSIVIGMLMVAALATLIANQSSNRGEIDKSGKMIENGRYAVQTIATDAEMAGYWGELTASDLPAAPGVLSDPCSATLADIEAALGVAVQGYDSLATLPASLQVCVKNHKPNTDVLVIRRVDPDTSDMETAGVIVPTKAVAGQLYLQTGLSGLTFSKVLRVADGTTDAAAFNLKKRDASPAFIRKVQVHIYYVAKCSVEVGGACPSTADNGSPIPTLKRVELSVASSTPSTTCSACRITIAEGIENMQIDYGADTAGDGTPVGADASTFGAAGWADVMTLKVNLLARSTEATAGFADNKAYQMGSTGGAVPIATGADAQYKRHVFTQSVRLANPAGRRSL
jgi:type IV pilus assembly protein PilW